MPMPHFAAAAADAADAWLFVSASMGPFFFSLYFTYV